MKNQSCHNCTFCKRHYTFDEKFRLIQLETFHCVSPIKGRRHKSPETCLHYKKDTNKKTEDIIKLLSVKYGLILERVETICNYLEELSQSNEKKTD